VKSIGRSLLLEILVLAALLVAVDLLVFPGCLTGIPATLGRPEVRPWNPSPVWLLVLLVAMRYGSPAGIFGGAVAAGVHIWSLTYHSDFSFQDIFHRSADLLIHPILYVAVGMFVGEARERLARRADHFAKEVADRVRELDASEIKRLNLERARIDMEKRLASQPDTLRGVYESLNHLNGARTEAELWAALAEITRRGMDAATACVWRQATSELLAVAGASSGVVPRLASLAVRRRGVVTLADWTRVRDDTYPGAELAGMVTKDTENPVVLTVSGMGFGRLNRNTIVQFELFVRYAGAVAGTLRQQDRLRRASIEDPALGLHSEAYLKNRIREQALLARRYGTDLTLLACSLRRALPPKLVERALVGRRAP